MSVVFQHTIAHIITENNAAELKSRYAAPQSAPHAKSWRADLHVNIPAAIGWANASPVSQPGEIIFNIKDNGQVWTYTFL